MTDKIALLDTNVIIDCSKYMLSIDRIIDRYDKFYISIISYIELFGFNFKNLEEHNIIKETLLRLQIKHINMQIADFAIDYRKIKKIKLADALILATARQLQADLITSNIDDFTYIDNHVSIFKPIDL